MVSIEIVLDNTQISGRVVQSYLTLIQYSGRVWRSDQCVQKYEKEEKKAVRTWSMCDNIITESLRQLRLLYVFCVQP